MWSAAAMPPLSSRRRAAAMPPLFTSSLRRRHVAFIDLDERVLAEFLLQRLERRHFGRQALLDLEDMPGGFRLDRADDLAGRRVEHGLVELGEELAAAGFAEVA